MGKRDKWIAAVFVLSGLLLILWGGPADSTVAPGNTAHGPEGETVATAPPETAPILETEAPPSAGFREVDGRIHYFDQNGVRVTGWLKLDNYRYYLTQEGLATGIRSVDGILYLFDRDGKLATGWADVENGAAYANHNGHPVSGWQTIDGRTYYFREDHLMETGWTEIDGLVHCFRPDGTPMQGITPEGHFASNGQWIPLVNPWHTISENYTVELTPINSDYLVADFAYDDFRDMMLACEEAGFHASVCSAYRTQEYQQKLFDRKVRRLLEDTSLNYTPEEARTVAARSVAIPGTSEHQLGLAIDLVDNNNWTLDESQAQMPAQQWLMENSWRYGWILRYPIDKSEITGIIYEPWHYRYVGKTVAAEIHGLGMCLEEYLQMLTVGIG